MGPDITNNGMIRIHFLTSQKLARPSSSRPPKTPSQPDILRSCKGKDCKKHTQHKMTQYKAGKVGIFTTEEESEQILTLPQGLVVRTGKASLRS
jgi:hypothetical protein